MDDAARARAAAREAVEDVTPPRLRDLIDEHLRRAAVAPGALTRLAARATDRDVDPAALDRRAAGVQLIYDGLRLTRSLAREPPWTDGDVADGNLDVLAADVLVARGFHLLARTEAAPVAVETVRAVGRDETNRAAGRPDPELADRALEADVFELAIVAGVTATGLEAPGAARNFAVDLARAIDDDPPAAPELLSEPAIEALADLAGAGRSEATPDRIWAGGSASDP